MKVILSAGFLIVLTAVAVAEEQKSPWSGSVTDRSYGPTGTTTSIIKKDVGDGWAVGGQMTTKYQEPKVGGSGVVPGDQYGSKSGNTVFGPYLEKKF